MPHFFTTVEKEQLWTGNHDILPKKQFKTREKPENFRPGRPWTTYRRSKLQQQQHGVQHSNPLRRQICFVRIELTLISTGLAQNLTGWYWYLSISIDTIGLNWLVHFEWIRVDWHRLQWTDAVLNRLARLAWIGNRSHGSAPFWMDLQELASVWIGIGSNGLSRKRPVSVP